MANWSTQTPNTPDTSFYTGSLTKQFTAMSILMLQYQGKLDISGLVCTYITPCPPPWADVTVKELLTHTSGIPYVPNGGYPTDVSPSVWIASFDTVPLDFPAGSAFEYCNVCYQVLGYITQLVSGLPFSQFVQENILDPLHMTESGFDEAPYYASPSSAIGYSSWQVSAETLGWDPDVNWSFRNASGLLYSSVKDLNRWDQALSTDFLLPQSVLAQAFTPYVTATSVPGSQYGYGWFISQAPITRHTLIWHDGVLDGFQAFNGLYVNDHITLVILSNLSTVDAISL